MTTEYLPTTDYRDRKYSAFFARRDPAHGPGWYVFGVASNVSARVVKVCARPNVAPRRHRHYSCFVRRGWHTKREAQSIADSMNATRRWIKAEQYNQA